MAFDSDIDSKPPVLFAASRLVRMIERAGGDAWITFIGASPDGRKRGVDDLYVAVGGDAIEFQRVLRDAERPANPERHLESLVSRWDSLSAERKAVELARAVRMAETLLGTEAFTFWCDTARDRLHVTKDRLFRARFAQDSQTGQSEWMTAPGYSVNRNGVFRTGSKKQVACAPINIVEVGEDSAQQKYATVRFQYGSDSHDVPVPRSTIAGADLLDLAALGAPVNQANRADMQTFLMAQEQANLSRLPKVRVHTDFGWSEDRTSFVLGRHVLGAKGRSVAVADPQFLDAFAACGDERVYLDFCRRFRAQSPVAELHFAMGYVGPLIQLLGSRSLVVSIWGYSGSGKSAMQALAASPWGRPERIMVSGDITSAAVDGLLIRSRDGLVWIDDTQLTKSEELLAGLAYQIVTGTTRARATVAGSLRPAKSWSAVASISGERPLLQLGAAAGARNRTIELRVSQLPDVTIASEAHRLLKQHHGHTGPKFIQALLREYITPGRVTDLKQQQRKLARELDANSGEHSLMIALMLVADVLARVHVFGEAEEQAYETALSAGKAVFALASESAATTQSMTDVLYEGLVSRFAQYEYSFTTMNEYGAVFEHPERPGVRVVAILPQVFQRWLKEMRDNVNAQQFCTELKDRELLIPGEPGRLTKKTPLRDKKERPRAYWVVLPSSDADEPGPSPIIEPTENMKFIERVEAAAEGTR